MEDKEEREGDEMERKGERGMGKEVRERKTEGGKGGEGKEGLERNGMEKEGVRGK